MIAFFYPRAMTRGCTSESCHFRDLRAEFEQVGARAIGSAPTARGDVRHDTNRRVLAAYRSELDMDAHADRALQTLRERVDNT